MATHISMRRGRGITTVLRIFAAIAMIAGISLTTLGTASTASADSGICDVSNGYQKDDGGGTITGALRR